MGKEQLFQWCDAYLIGDEALDLEHQFMFLLLREFSHAVRRNEEDPDNIINAVNQLLDYSRHHFRNEENLMLLHQSSDYETHKQSHERLFSQVEEIIDEFRPGYRERLTDSLPVIEEWIKDHILKEDRKLVSK